MADPRFAYVAVDPAGRRTRGILVARDQAAAFDELKRDGLSPLRLTLQTKETPARTVHLTPREAAEFLSSLAELLTAGADIRTALGILGARFERAAVKDLAQQLAADIGGGMALDQAFSRVFDRKQPFVGPMIAAGEAAGDLSGGLQRSADIITSRLKLRDQMASVMAYPTFVFTAAIGAVLVILMFIVPSLAPLAEQLGAEPSLAMKLMLGASNFLRDNFALLGGGFLALVFGGFLAWRAGLLSRPLEQLLLDGPFRRTARGLVFGAFAQTLGAMVGAGAPIGDALRLAVRAVPYRGVRGRLESVLNAVRQGAYLSDALADVRGFPGSVVRLVAVGEASNAVGPLLMRSGRMEEDSALRRIEAVGRIAGPAMIVVLGAMLGLLMAGLLSGVSGFGQSTLN